MSHFTVMVITDNGNVEEALAPYHEYECTGLDDKYVIDVDKTEEVEEWLKEELFVGENRDGEMSYQYYENKAKENLKSHKKMTRKEYFDLCGFSVDIEINDWFGFEKKNGVWMNHTNPNAKWDWWVEGGRWSGFLKTKDGKEVNSASFKDIDFEGMRKKQEEAATLEYDTASKTLDGVKFKTWAQVMNMEDLSIDEKREFYRNQEGVKLLREKIGIWKNPDDFLADRETYIRHEAISSYLTYAFVKDGTWSEKGQMGWWGMSSNEKDPDDWHTNFQEMLDSIKPDQHVTIVDCHI